MATEALKSTSITNMDASPPVFAQAGMGGQGYMLTAGDRAISTAGVTVGSTYRLARIPTNAKVKRVLFTAANHGAATAFDIDVAHSDSITDGTPPNLQGNIVQISSADNKLFGSAVSAVAANNNTDVTFTGTFTTQFQNMELWNVLVTLGATTFSSDPGGFFDILLKSTATDTNGGNLGIEVDYVC
jgi:hypothetical protein